MLNPKDISDYPYAGKEQKRLLETKMQRDDLSYLSSVSFEQFNVTDAEIMQLTQRIDKKVKGNSTPFNTIFISVLCGLLIGISVFFIIFQKSKTHASVFQPTEKEWAAIPPTSSISHTDSILPVAEKIPVEHYHTVESKIEETAKVELMEPLAIKSLTATIPPEKDNEEIVFAFTDNAPVIFIHNLKVTNYRLYYFKQSEAITLDDHHGLSAQYGNAADIEKTNRSQTSKYYAHKIIQQAMRLFNSKHIANCIEELTLLYNYNHDDANAQFYLGMCYYQLGKYNIAQNYFQKNLDNINNIFHQESEFYKALCLLNTGQTEEATKQLQTIVDNKGFYATRAQETLSKSSK